MLAAPLIKVDVPVMPRVPVVPQARFAGAMAANKHWKSEKLLSVGLLGLLPAAIIMPCMPLDLAVAVALPIHNYWLAGQRNKKKKVKVCHLQLLLCWLSITSSQKTKRKKKKKNKKKEERKTKNRQEERGKW